MCLHARELTIPLIGNETRTFVAPDPFVVVTNNEDNHDEETTYGYSIIKHTFKYYCHLPSFIVVERVEIHLYRIYGKVTIQQWYDIRDQKSLKFDVFLHCTQRLYRNDIMDIMSRIR